MCVMICGAADCLWWMKIWCVHFKRRLETTDDSPLQHISCIFSQISWSLLHQIVSGKVKFQKLYANCVPKLLMEEHKLQQQATTFDFLTQYSEEGENSLSHVVTRNETWVSHEEPKSKQQSMEWRHTSLPTKMKFKQTTSNRKVMCCILKSYCVLSVMFCCIAH